MYKKKRERENREIRYPNEKQRVIEADRDMDILKLNKIVRNIYKKQKFNLK